MNLNPVLPFLFTAIAVTGYLFIDSWGGIVALVSGLMGLVLSLLDNVKDYRLKWADKDLEFIRIAKDLTNEQIEFILALELQPGTDWLDFTEKEFRFYLYKNLGTFPSTPSMNRLEDWELQVKEKRMIRNLQSGGFVVRATGKEYQWVKPVEEAIKYYFGKEQE